MLEYIQHNRYTNDFKESIKNLFFAKNLYFTTLQLHKLCLQKTKYLEVCDSMIVCVIHKFKNKRFRITKSWNKIGFENKNLKLMQYRPEKLFTLSEKLKNYLFFVLQQTLLSNYVVNTQAFET